ncbi:MAG: hypothetical protein LKF69_05300 [Bacilli bacterium]|jgi:hypothetical protein|nr:hypothetical protein [Bacilli bacterium]MCH4236192.1 hypothetical protein [Bacilli bacterium]
MDETRVAKKEANSSSLFGFFIIEIVFFLGLNLDYNGTFIRLLGIFILAYGLYLAVNNHLISWKQEKKINLIASELVLLIFGIGVALSLMFSSSGFINIISLALAFISFFLLGRLFHAFKDFTFTHLILAFAIGMAILLLISLATTFIRYGFLYRLIYSGKVVYFDGAPIHLDREATWLYGFNLYETSMDGVGMFVVPFASLSIPGFFYALETAKTKKKWFLFAIPFVFLLPLLVFPYIQGLLYLLPLIIILIMLELTRLNPRVMKIVWIALATIAFCGLAVSILWANDIVWAVKLIDSTPLTHSLFSHPYILRYKEAIAEVFKYPFGTLNFFSDGHTYSTQNILLDTLRQAGLIPFFALITLLAMMINESVRTYFRVHDPIMKFTYISLLLSFVTYALINYPFVPLMDASNQISFPLANNGIWLFLIVVFGYCMNHSQKSKEVI